MAYVENVVGAINFAFIKILIKPCFACNKSVSSFTAIEIQKLAGKSNAVSRKNTFETMENS